MSGLPFLPAHAAHCTGLQGSGHSPAEGIDLNAEELPELTIKMDIENAVCAYSTAESKEVGIVEVLEVFPGDENGSAASTTVKITLESGEAF